MIIQKLVKKIRNFFEKNPLSLVICILLLFFIIREWPLFSFDKNYQSLNMPPPQIKEVTAEQAFSFIQSNNKIKLIYLYASWCGACRKKLPDFLDIARKYQNNPECEILMISLDDNIMDLQKLLYKQRPFNFTPMIFNSKVNNQSSARSEYKIFLSHLLTKGVYSSGTIPFIALLSKESNPINFGNGISYDVIDSKISQYFQSNNSLE